MMGGIHMIQGHANLDVLDNCDLHPVQCVCVFFLTDFSVFSEKIRVKIQLILLMSLEIFAKFLESLNWKKEKTPLILLSNVSHKVY
jgi:hypothetical protein